MTGSDEDPRAESIHSLLREAHGHMSRKDIASLVAELGPDEVPVAVTECEGLYLKGDKENCSLKNDYAKLVLTNSRLLVTWYGGDPPSQFRDNWARRTFSVPLSRIQVSDMDGRRFTVSADGEVVIRVHNFNWSFWVMRKTVPKFHAQLVRAATSAIG